MGAHVFDQSTPDRSSSLPSPLILAYAPSYSKIPICITLLVYYRYTAAAMHRRQDCWPLTATINVICALLTHVFTQYTLVYDFSPSGPSYPSIGDKISPSEYVRSVEAFYVQSTIVLS